MNKTLLLSLAALCCVQALNAQMPTATPIKGHVVNATPHKGRRVRTVPKLNPRLEADGNQFSLWESFETDGDKNFPDGWITSLTNDLDWYVGSPLYSGVTPTDGYYAGFATCFNLHDASWLISPEFTPMQGEQLMFDLYFDVRSLYVWSTEGDDKNIDEEDGLILKRENAENMKVCVSVDGGEWVEINNLWDKFGKLGYWDIMYDYSEPEFRRFTIDMSEYAGKNVKIGFCHQYLNEDFGYGMFLDAVRVSKPSVETSYMLPMGLMFFGITDELLGFQNMGIVPYNTPITWLNLTGDEDMQYKWEYSNIATESCFSSSDMDLDASYAPDYSDDPETPHTAYTFPTLTATNASGTSGSYTYADGVGAIMAGSDPELPTVEGDILKFGMTTFDPADDLQICNADFSTPAFGHSPMTKDWWTDHYFQGEQEEGDMAEITSNINFFYTTGNPIVIDAVRVVSMVECEPDAEFKLEVVSLNEDFTPGTVLAETSLKGSRMVAVDMDYAPFPDMYILPFMFDKPVVVDGVNFFVRVSGFNSDKVTLYAPVQSYEPKELCYSFATLHTVSPSMGADVESIIPASLDDNYVSYVMMLDAHYPYLTCADSEFESSMDEPSKTFNLESSYPAEELEVEDEDGALPEWLEVEKSGRYGNAKLTVTVKGGGNNEIARLMVSAPSVSKDFVIKRGAWSGIDELTDAVAEVGQQIFDLSGRRLSAEPADGIYIVKRVKPDGSATVEKVVR